MSDLKRRFHVAIGALKPGLNLAMGVFIGQGKWNFALVVFGAYLLMTLIGDTTFWSVMDDRMKVTRQKLEKNLELKHSI